MEIIGTVYGNGEQAKPLIIGKDTVYVHTDIAPVIKDGDALNNVFTYTEVQYEKDEYIKFMEEQNEQLSAELTDAQLALCEMYETFGGAE